MSVNPKGPQSKICLETKRNQIYWFLIFIEGKTDKMEVHAQ